MMNEFNVIKFDLPKISDISNKVWMNSPSNFVVQVYNEIAVTVNVGINDSTWKGLGHYLKFYYEE